MGQTAEELREELADRRNALGADFEAIGDRVSPGRIVERRRAAFGQTMTRARERVMGVADDTTSAVGGTASSIKERGKDVASTVADAAMGAPGAIKERTEGAPLAAGLVAFGAGFLAASLLPASRAEEQVAARIQPALESAAGEVGTAGQAVGQELAAEAKEATQEVATSAKEAASGLKDQVRDAPGARAEEAQRSGNEVPPARPDVEGTARSRPMG